MIRCLDRCGVQKAWVVDSTDSGLELFTSWNLALEIWHFTPKHRLGDGLSNVAVLIFTTKTCGRFTNFDWDMFQVVQFNHHLEVEWAHHSVIVVHTHITPQHPKPHQLSFIVYLPGTSNDMLPTPSPVSYRRVKQEEEEMSWKAAKQTPVWPQHTGWFGNG